MDIKTINTAIERIEQEEATISNVAELADLYIVRDKLSLTGTSQDPEIFSTYNNYCNVKCRYQKGETSEEAVVEALTLLCQDITDFLQKLYCNTDMRKERIIIEKILSNLSTQFCS